MSDQPSLKILAFLGSPRRGGNTEILLDEAVSAAQAAGAETDKVVLSRLEYEGCRECGGCDQTGSCVVQDDMQELYPKIREADRIIIASPVFFAGSTSQTKAMFDRNQANWVGKYKLKKNPEERPRGRLGAIIAVSGLKNPEIFRGLGAEVRAFFRTNDVTYLGGLFFPGIDQRGEVSGHKAALEAAGELGRFLADGGPRPEALVKEPWVGPTADHRDRGPGPD
ncbi:MAG TPA: flavodoxin family protein [Bacillota bacterium]|jgi:multimeric flavodoxin WrbA